MNSHEVFIHIHQGRFDGTGTIVRLPQCQWSKPDGYGKISQCITTTMHSKAVTVCIFLGIYCRYQWWTVKLTPITRIMGPSWGPSRADRTQVGPPVGPMNFAIWEVQIILLVNDEYISKTWSLLNVRIYTHYYCYIVGMAIAVVISSNAITSHVFLTRL